MGAEREINPHADIHARTSSGPSTSIGALAAYLGQACGHVWLDERCFDLGYRFYAALSDEIPNFFIKRVKTGSSTVAVTVQSGISFDGEDPFDECQTTKDAKHIISGDGYQPSLWLTSISINGQLHPMEKVSGAQFIAQYPNEFRVIAEELVALGAVKASSCPFCTHS